MWKTCVMMMEEWDVRRSPNYNYTEVKGLKLMSATKSRWPALATFTCPGLIVPSSLPYRTNALATSTALSKLTLVHHYRINQGLYNTDSQPKYTEWKCIHHPPQTGTSYISYPLLPSRASIMKEW